MCPKSHCNKEYHIRGDFLNEKSRTPPFPPHVHVHYILLPAHGPLRNWPQAANIPLVIPWSSKRGSRSCLLGHRGFSVGRFFFFPPVMRMGKKGVCTPDIPATFHHSLEDVIKRSSSLGGQDYDTSLLPEIKEKPIPVTKLRGRQEKRWTCHNLVLSIHLFIWKSRCKSTTSQALGRKRGTNRNNPLTQIIYCLVAETNITQIFAHFTMKSAPWNNNDKTRMQANHLSRLVVLFPICWMPKANRSSPRWWDNWAFHLITVSLCIFFLGS